MTMIPRSVLQTIFPSLIVLMLWPAIACSDINFVSWGGSYAKSQRSAFTDPWTAKTGQEVQFIDDYNGGLAEIRTQVESGEVIWDVVDVFGHDARAGCDEGLFEKIPFEIFSKPASSNSIADDLIIPLPNECVVPNIVWSWIIFYDRASFRDSDQPRTIADFFDVAKYPGPRGLSAFPQANLEMALVAEGVAPENVYQILNTKDGINRAFKKLETIRESALTWSSGEEPLEMVRQGKVVMSTAYSGRVGAAILEGEDLIPIWDGQVIEEEWLVIVKGTANLEQALDFVAHVAEPKQQAAIAKWIPYGPMRKSALDIIAEGEPWFYNGKEVLPLIPDNPELLSRSVIANSDWWKANGQELTIRYKEFLGIE